jgi:hypothetical protein
MSIRSIFNSEIKDVIQATVRQKLLEGYATDDMPTHLFSAGRANTYPTLMAELLKSPDVFSQLEKRIEYLNLDSLAEYYACGEDCLVFTLGRKYLLRLAPAYNFSFDLNADSIPSPMVKPAYHERLNIGQHGIRIMIMPRLAPFTGLDFVHPKMWANRSAMSFLGYKMVDEGIQNFMHFAGDDVQTPFCIDYGVYTVHMKTEWADGKKIPIPITPKKEPPEGITVKGYYWKGLHRKFYPVYNLKTSQERLDCIRSEVSHELGISLQAVRQSNTDRSSIVFE